MPAVTQQVEAERGDIEAAVRRQAAAADPSLETQVKTAVLAQVFADQGGMTIEQYDQLVAAGQIPQQVQDKINATVNAQVEAKIAELTQQQVDLAIENAMNSAKVQDQITAALEAAASGAAQISALKSGSWIPITNSTSVCAITPRAWRRRSPAPAICLRASAT